LGFPVGEGGGAEVALCVGWTAAAGRTGGCAVLILAASAALALRTATAATPVTTAAHRVRRMSSKFDRFTPET
jgi:hypothetical protein